MSVQFGFAAGVDTEWCATSPANRRLMLCRRPLGHVPTPQPGGRPSPLHDECARLLDARPELLADDRPDLDTGVCPACAGAAPVERGLIGEHGRWVWRCGRWARSMEWCPGVGSEPEEEA